MPILRAFHVRVTLTWGFTVRQKEVSAAQPALPLPPPTTVVGAFAYPLLRLLSVNAYTNGSDRYLEHRLITPAMKHLLESTLVASASLAGGPLPDRAVGLAVHQEFGKLVAAPYKGGGSWGKAAKTWLFTDEFYETGVSQALVVQAVGATYGPGAVLELLWVLDIEQLSKRMKVEPEDIDGVAEEAVHGVVRVGGKEGLVAVDHGRTLYDKNVKTLGPGGTFATGFYVEKDCVTPIETYLVNEVTLWGLNGRPKTFYVASKAASNNIVVPIVGGVTPHYRVLEPCRAYVLSNNAVGVGKGLVHC